MADIYGTSGSDFLNGTSGDDNIFGLEGDDTLNGGAGADQIQGGDGNDTVIVDSLDTVIHGGTGIDTLTVEGTGGVSLNILGASIEIVNGGSGDDNFTTLLNPPQPPPSINEYYLARTIHGNDGNDVIHGVYADGDMLYGDNGNDTLDGWLGADYLSGGAGDDRLTGWFDGNAADTLVGGTGDDVYEVDSADIIVESANEGTDTVIVGSSHTLGENLENLTMAMWYATGDLTGNVSNNVLTGNETANVLTGLAGNDTLIGGAGNDTYVFNLGDGADTIQDMSLSGEENRIRFGQGITAQSLSFADEGGVLRIDIGANGDSIRLLNFSATSQTVVQTVEFSDGSTATLLDLINNSGNLNQIIGTPLNDYLYGTSQNDEIQGLGGNDQLSGLDGHDVLLGGAGDDFLQGDAGNDLLNGGAGNDLLQDYAGSDTYVFGLGSGTDTVQDWGWDVADVDTVVVGQGVTPNTLFVTQDWATNPGGLTLRLAQSEDQLQIQGNNVIERIQFADGTVWDQGMIQARVQQVQTGTAGNDYLSGYGLNNYLDGGAGDDTLYGNSGTDALLGGAGNDYLSGGSGNDTYVGGAGNDLLQDYAGSDTYVFGVGSGTDTVQDWGWDVADVDTVVVGQGATPSTLFVTQDWATNPGGLTLRLAQSDDQLQIQGNNVIERIQFADGTVWDQGMIQARVQQVQTGTAGNDYLSGYGLNNYLDGGAGDDTLYGNSGMDALMGGAGNDQLYGSVGDDVYNWSAGNDLMQDSGGSDTYVFGLGSGTDTVQDWGWDVADVDRVVVGQGVTPSTLFVTQDWATNPGGLTLRLAQSNDQLIIQNFNSIEQLQFADGTVWDQAMIQARVQQVQTGTAGNDYLSGYGLNNYLDGGAGDDQLVTGNGHDALLGGAGNDVLSGGYGDDTYVGGAGNDLLQDYAGSDTYVFGLGSGTDTVQDWGWDVADVDTVVVGQGVTPSTLFVTQDWATGGVLTLRLAQSDDQLVIQNFNSMERIQFADGTVWDQGMIQARVQHVQTGTPGNDFFSGSSQGDYVQGLGGDDTLYGGDGHDALLGGAGHDTLEGGFGNDLLNGGTGNDLLQDYAGSDTYVFEVGSGTDTVQDWGWDVADVDTVVVGQGVTPSTLFVTQDWATNPGGLTLRLAQSDDQLVIQNFNSIERIQFADGTVWDQAMIQLRLQQSLTGTEGDDYLWGSAESNYMQGLGGNDSLSGNDGDDVLLGGAGDDVLQGGFGHDVYDGGAGVDSMMDFSGSDTYRWGVGSGQDTVSDLDFTPGNIDRVEVLSGVAPNDVTITRDWGVNPNAITLRLNATGDALTLLDWFNPNGQIEEIRFADGTVWDQAAVLARLETTLTGTEGDDNLFGSELADTISGLGGHDSLNGQAGDDVLDGGTGADQMLGRSGDDTFIVDDAADVVTEFTGEGNDQVFTSVSFSLAVDAEIETMILTGTDSIDGTGSSTNNTIIGNSGNNTLDGGLGSDVLQGGAGHDVYVIDNMGDSVTENLNEGIDRVQSSVTYALGTNIEHLTLIGPAAINGTGNELDNLLTGNSAVNILSGGAGDDTYIVGAGDSVVEGDNEGTDLVQSNVSFVLSANVENLTLTGTGVSNGTGNSLNNILLGNVAANVLNGAAGADHMTGWQGDDTYVVDNAGDTVTEVANEGFDTVQSSITYTLGANVENLTLSGSSAINGTGNSLDNVLTGNSAANVLTGGAGNDIYVIGTGDSIAEAAGGGIDTVQSALTYTLGANVEHLTLTGSATINGTGNSLNNVLTGNSAANVLTGGAGNDTYVVGAGDSVVESNNNGTDTVQSSATWTLGSNLENLTLTGTAAINGTGNGSANILTGNSANNVLSASGGADTLRGGAGNDTVNGGSGNDTYLFGRGEGQDLVQDSGGSADRVAYDAGINPLDLVISRQANDLRLSIHGSTDYVTVQNWYTSSSNRTETIQAGNGQVLLSTQVDQLIQAMASFSQQTGLTWDQAIDQQPQQVQNILAANWQ